MRRALACFLILATLAGSAVAQTTTSARPTTPGNAQSQNDSPALPPPLIPLTGASQTRDPDQCRASCNRTYFFCRASGDEDSCPTQWMQCKTRCTATYSSRPLGN